MRSNKDTYIDVSTELQIVPYLNGLRLIRPVKAGFNNDYLTIQEVLNFPCNVYILDVESVILSINDRSATSSGFYSTSDAVGRTVFDVLITHNATSITNIDRQVIHKNHTILNEDVMIRDDIAPMSFLTVKAPIYNDTTNIVGILGCSVMLDQQPLAESLTLISNLGLLKLQNKSSSISVSYNTICTPREKQVINLLIRGKTAKEIAFELNLSKRTIEHYIENIKLKMNVDTKSQLIEKVLNLNCQS